MSAATTPPPTPRKLRPGVAGYWIGGGLVLVGIVGALVWFVLGLVGISNTVDDFERVPADGGGMVTLADDTGYVIYLEDRSGAAVRVALTDPSGDEIDIRTYVSDLDYDFGGRAGTALFTFRSNEAGDYDLTSESTSLRADVAVGPSLAGDLVRAIAIPFAIGGVGLLAGVILLIVTLVRRSADKKRRDAPAVTPTPPPSGFPPPSPGYPPAR